MSSFSCLRKVMAISLLAANAARASSDADKSRPSVLVLESRDSRRDDNSTTRLEDVVPIPRESEAVNQSDEDSESGKTSKSGIKCLWDNPVINAFTKNETGGLLGGLAMTTGGTIWALNRLQEALDDLKQTGEVDPISGGYGFIFTLLLILGPTLLVHTVFRKFAPESGNLSKLALGLTAVAGLTCGLGVCYQSAQDIAAMTGLYAVTASFLVLVLVILVVAHSSKKNVGAQPLKLLPAIGHAIGFMSFVGGFGFLSYNVTENLADAQDSLGRETAVVWFFLAIGFTWLMTSSMGCKGMTVGQYVCLTLTAGSAAGLLAGGIELALLENVIGSAVCFGLFGAITLLILMAKFSQLGCCKRIAKMLGIKAKN